MAGDGPRRRPLLTRGIASARADAQAMLRVSSGRFAFVVAGVSVTESAFVRS